MRGVIERQLAFARQFQLVGCAVKQLFSQLIFQQLDRRAEGRLGHAQFLCSLAEAVYPG